MSWDFSGSQPTFDSGRATFDGAGVGAGRHHRKHYGVRDGDHLLVFDTRKQADEARAAIKAREKTPEKERKPVAIRVKPVADVPLIDVQHAAAAAGQAERYERLLVERAHTALYEQYQRWQQEAAARKQAEAAAAEERFAREYLTQLHAEREEFLSHVGQAVVAISAHLDQKKRLQERHRAAQTYRRVQRMSRQLQMMNGLLTLRKHA